MLLRELYAQKSVCQKSRYVVFEQLSQLNTGKFTNMQGKLLVNYIHSYIHRNCPYLEAEGGSASTIHQHSAPNRGSASRIHQHTVPKRDHLQNSSTSAPQNGFHLQNLSTYSPANGGCLQNSSKYRPPKGIRLQNSSFKWDPPLYFNNQKRDCLYGSSDTRLLDTDHAQRGQ